MSVVLRDDIAKTLFRFGKRVEKEIMEGNKLDIIGLNNLLKPTLESIESKAVSFATKEIEENIAKNHDNTRKRKREKICEKRRATLSEKVILETPMKKVRICQTLASNIRKSDDAISYSPIGELDCLSDSEIIKYDTDDDSWDPYLHEVRIDGEGEYSLCAGDLDDLLDYLDDNTNTVDEMLPIIESIKEKDILTYGYFLPGMISLCKLLARKKSDAAQHQVSENEFGESVYTRDIEEISDEEASESLEDIEIVIE